LVDERRHAVNARQLALVRSFFALVSALRLLPGANSGLLDYCESRANRIDRGVNFGLVGKAPGHTPGATNFGEGNRVTNTEALRSRRVLSAMGRALTVLASVPTYAGGGGPEGHTNARIPPIL
jgi:hypothetical protein